MIAVSDASPLIGLSSAGRLRLLRQIYESVLIPQQVHTDVVMQGHGRAGSRAVANAIAAGWLQVTPVRDRALIPGQFSGTGEGEAIALTQELEADVILLDDRAPRNYCGRIGLRWISTAGVVLEAKEIGVIRKVKPVLDRMQAKGYGVWDCEEILKLAGE